MAPSLGWKSIRLLLTVRGTKTPISWFSSA